MKMDMYGHIEESLLTQVHSPTRIKNTKVAVTMSLLNGKMVMLLKSLEIG